MSIHSSLKTKSGALSQHRNVLNRAERILKLTSQEKFEEKKNSPLGLSKVANRFVGAKKKAKAVEGEAGAVAGAPGAPAAAGAAPAAGGKPGAPVAAKPGAKPVAGAPAGKSGGDKKK